MIFLYVPTKDLMRRGLPMPIWTFEALWTSPGSKFDELNWTIRCNAGFNPTIILFLFVSSDSTSWLIKILIFETTRLRFDRIDECFCCTILLLYLYKYSLYGINLVNTKTSLNKSGTDKSNKRDIIEYRNGNELYLYD